MPDSGAARGTTNVLIDEITDWLMAEALGENGLTALVDGTADRLDAAGIPLTRMHISMNTLHPLYETIGYTWERGKGVEVVERPHSEISSGDWLASPFYHMIKRRLPVLRRRLSGPDAVLDFPLLDTYAANGATDYLAFAIPFSIVTAQAEDDGVAASWMTARSGGFSDTDIRALTRVTRRLAVACRMMIRGQVAGNVVTTYLGETAGLRVLRGQIRRGDGETIRAAVWYSDLRGSTAMAETLGREAFIGVLNDYFGCTAEAVKKRGGTVLNFIGDAVLAMFPLDGRNAAEASAAALAAAHDARQRLAAANIARQARGETALEFGLGLHLGDVMFGNIGTPDRLSFNVIGPTVNEVARLEGLTKELGRPVLVSGPFAEAHGGDWESLGERGIRGSARKLAVFAPK